MSDYNQVTLKDAIDKLFSTMKIKGKVSETRLISSWEKVMGKMIANHTRKLYINKGRLFVYLDNAALRSELNYSRDMIVRNLNEEAGEELVKEVIIR